MPAFMTALEAAGGTIAGYAGTAMGAGLAIGIVVLGGKRAWRAFKSIS